MHKILLHHPPGHSVRCGRALDDSIEFFFDDYKLIYNQLNYATQRENSVAISRLPGQNGQWVSKNMMDFCWKCQSNPLKNSSKVILWTSSILNKLSILK